MNYLLLFSFGCLFNIFGYAHQANEAFFKITEKKNRIEIQVEFPWTIRYALIKFNPSLKNSATKFDFENTFVAYIKENLILKNKNEDVFNFQEYQ